MCRTASLLLFAALALPGCGATASGALPPPPAMSNVRAAPVAPPVEGGGELPPQDLAPGACATFFWTDTEHRFVAFENETEGYARVYANGREHGFYTPPREGPYVTGEAYRRDYVDPQRGLDIRISGLVGEPLPQGQRIDRTVMRVLQPNGQTLVVPLAGHYACRAAVGE